ncbi:MAG: SMC-Scp complex subunit ScpB [Deltaproteobacteria bacterium]|nr:SMC-Scp complex subunit ScpB [Deltaproteobacteria bacterium]
MDQMKNIIESLLFAAQEPITISRLKKILSLENKEKIIKTLNELAEEYETRKGGFHLKETAGGFQLKSRPEYGEWIKKLLEPSPYSRLSKAALETLSITAYKQPILRAEIEYIRGVDSGGIIRNLLDKGLIKIIGRKDIPGKPMLYGTTKRFLEVFELKSLKELPTLKEIAEINNE